LSSESRFGEAGHELTRGRFGRTPWGAGDSPPQRQHGHDGPRNPPLAKVMPARSRMIPSSSSSSSVGRGDPRRTGGDDGLGSHGNGSGDDDVAPSSTSGRQPPPLVFFEGRTSSSGLLVRRRRWIIRRQIATMARNPIKECCWSGRCIVHVHVSVCAKVAVVGGLHVARCCNPHWKRSQRDSRFPGREPGPVVIGREHAKGRQLSWLMLLCQEEQCPQ
jgi:hypothetical protein